jgi:transcriptional regulator with XRE-family HTH domain
MLTEKKKQRNHDQMGLALKEARVREGYSQKALADSLGIEYYTMISQMELGYMSIPPTLWTPIADKLRLNRADWVLRCLTEIMPEVYHAIFGIKSISEVSKYLTLMDKGDTHV